MARNPFSHRASRLDSGLSAMKNIIFPYGIRFQEDGKIAVFPAAQARIKSSTSESLLGTFLIDSGATISVLPAGDAEVLGIDLQKGTKIVIRGLGATDFLGYRHVIQCEIQKRTLKLPVVFVDHPATLRIFGREGLFKKFIIVFDEQKQRTLFLDPNMRICIEKLLD